TRAGVADPRQETNQAHPAIAIGDPGMLQIRTVRDPVAFINLDVVRRPQSCLVEDPSDTVPEPQVRHRVGHIRQRRPKALRAEAIIAVTDVRQGFIESANSVMQPFLDPDRSTTGERQIRRIGNRLERLCLRMTADGLIYPSWIQLRGLD